MVHRMPRAAVTSAFAVAAAIAVAGCGSQIATSGHGQPPKLHIGTASDAVAAGEAAPMMAPVPGGLGLYGGYVLVGSLPTTPTHAAVWRWSDSSASRADVSRLGALLGLTGTPQRHAHGWLLASSGGELRVRDGDSLQWSYVRADQAACPPYSIDIDQQGDVASGCAVASAAAVAGATPSGSAVSDAAARALLAGLGITGAEHVDKGAASVTVTVAPKVGSLPTQGVETRVDVDGSGIRSANGHLGVPKSGADYPLRGAKAAFDDLGNGPRPMIAQYCGPMPSLVGGPEIAPSQARVAPAPSSGAASAVAPVQPSRLPVPPPSAVPPSGLPVPAPCPSPEPIRITGATLGLLAMWDGASGGPNVLVPAWFFSTEGSDYPVPVVAVDPSFIDSAPPAGSGGSAGGSSGSGGVSGSGNTSGSGGGPVPVPSSVGPVPPVSPTK